MELTLTQSLDRLAPWLHKVSFKIAACSSEPTYCEENVDIPAPELLHSAEKAKQLDCDTFRPCLMFGGQSTVSYVIILRRRTQVLDLGGGRAPELTVSAMHG